jgi:predicted MFS family arabinose efflux permease
MTIVVQRVPEHARATALALRLTGNRLGQVAVPAAAGLVAGSAGVGAVFWLLALMLVASGVAVQRPEPSSAPPPVEVAAAETAVE